MSPLGGYDDATIGARLRTLRRWRGKTQVELAGLAGLSPSFVSMVENGQRPLDRRSHIAALASALKVSETDLAGGPHLGPDADQSAPHSGIPALRVALETSRLSDPADDRARPVNALAVELRAIKDAYTQQCDYVSVGERLPAVLDELHVQAVLGTGEPDRTAALGLLVEAHISAMFMAKDLGYLDLAHVAALRAEDAAQMLGDPVAIGKAALVRFHSIPRAITSWDRGLAMAERSAAALEPHASDVDGVCVLGMLTLSAALAAAVLQRSTALDHWLCESAALAARVPDDMAANWWSFCSTNVAVWRVALALERGEGGGKIAELASSVDERKLTTRTRRADFLVDVGRGVARDPKAGAEAVGWLRRAEQAAPQRVRNYAPARESVAYLMARASAAAGGRELRGIAARMGVLH
jgi:transcriptional regulator with XRE-family HTH domain